MPISFSASAKAEICRILPTKRCCAIAECFGILLYCNSFSGEAIRIVTESREFANMLPRLFKKAFALTFDLIPDSESSGKLVFQITDADKLETIMDTYGFSRKSTLALHVNLPVLENECCKESFLRGVFLAGGSVTDPAKGYHLEVSTAHQSVSRETYALIQEMLPLQPKTAQRGGNQVMYLKQSDSISDFLTFLGAPVAAMGIMEARLEKELNNKVNRRCNCDDANITKVIEASQEQLVAIRNLIARGMLEKLPSKLQQAATARMDHPEASLAELAGLMDPPISKPAMNHRLQKLLQMSKETES